MTNSNGWAQKILGAFAALAIGGIAGGIVTWGKVEVNTSKIEAMDQRTMLMAEKMDKLRDTVDLRFRELERQVANANAKLDTMMNDKIAETRKPR